MSLIVADRSVDQNARGDQRHILARRSVAEQSATLRAKRILTQTAGRDTLETDSVEDRREVHHPQ